MEHHDVYIDKIGRRAPGTPERPWFDVLIKRRQVGPGDEVVIHSPPILGGGEASAFERFTRISNLGAAVLDASTGNRIEMTPEVRAAFNLLAQAGALGRQAKARAIKRSADKAGTTMGRPPEYDQRERGLLRLVWLTWTEGTNAELERAAGKAIGRERVSYTTLRNLRERYRWGAKGSRPDLIPASKKKAKRR